eukprot:TRINITY_DN2787_c2_g1_i17.p2 TRINITY_DN2787_c2_g1~~TRINITY_DN2787_c2_g1_i17.p2  ORF type:complete len:144 (-),score=13.34 TRINITY_DN2787_c2_g1_i17:312-743(-)
MVRGKGKGNPSLSNAIANKKLLRLQVRGTFELEEEINKKEFCRVENTICRSVEDKKIKKYKKERKEKAGHTFLSHIVKELVKRKEAGGPRPPNGLTVSERKEVEGGPRPLNGLISVSSKNMNTIPPLLPRLEYMIKEFQLRGR